MERRNQDLGERLLAFAAAVMKWVGKLRRTATGRYVADQLMRSAASSGANYEEARAAESRADFTHKLQLALKEQRESLYWLRLAAKAELVPINDVRTLLAEADQLVRILAKSIVTAKGRGKWCGVWSLAFLGSCIVFAFAFCLLTSAVCFAKE